ncbi:MULTISPECIES: TetR family transcriptional regulator [Kitasatospora]|uniref:Putative TetR family transcriptional regulator n=1 Tax=Kitasatospora setae (strain ATCC 33774 / DSM 43861 / JCM 3304 / KCC A-0304 / NBRC 14216 / KM-6054) TaxID=452652 RepID=E4NGA9_KITSK|nr:MULTISPECIES: TetR family transcriptional regulator [Kitasatospora]BAJ30539.1 putative TetR family transcriptional regulator [Kitasatospora setae KM-6054]
MTTPRSPRPRPSDPAPSSLEELVEAPLSLRERKKLKTRQSLRREAMRLFAEQGWEATTVDQIAAAAEVSPSTFFRYFPTKEDLLLTDEYDPLMAEAIRARPADEPFLVSARTVLVGLVRRIAAVERDELYRRMRLATSVPSVRARMLEGSGQPRGLLLDLLTERAGLAAPTLELRITAAAVSAALTETSLHWADGGAREDLADLLDRSLLHLQELGSR